MLRDRQVFGAGRQTTCRRFVERVLGLDGIRSIAVDRGRSTATIRYWPGEHTPKEMLEKMASAIRGGATLPLDQSVRDRLQEVGEGDFTVSRNGAPESPPGAAVRSPGAAVGPPMAHGLRRLAFLALAGGSFTMGVVGFLAPGIPATPFLLLCSYCLVRSSPRLNRVLMRSRLIRDWHEHGAMRPAAKIAALVTMAVVVAATILFSGLPVPLLVVIVVLVGVGIYAVLRVPTLTRNGKERATSGHELGMQT